MNSQKWLTGLSSAEIENIISDLGEPRFRSRQLYRWLYARREKSIENMTDLSLGLRERLAGIYGVNPVVVSVINEGFDGSIKALFSLPDSERVEGVLIPEGERLTACLSSQVGCIVNCQFCATGKMGFNRNLTSGEIVGQLIELERAASRQVTNVVMMGMGEPLLNRNNVFDAARLITDPEGMAMAKRRFTISTAGWLPGINAMTDEKLKVKLAVSLNGTTEEQRLYLMPMAARYPIEAILEAANEYSHQAGHRTMISYLLLHHFNDSDTDARRLVKLLERVPCKINIMEYNDIGADFVRSFVERTERFMEILRNANLTVMLRTSRGRDINGACGQLAAQYGNGAGKRVKEEV